MHRSILAIVAVAAITSSHPSHAAPAEDNFLLRNTGDLVALCSAQPADIFYTAGQNFCQGFAVGLYRGLLAQQAGLKDPLLCAPAQMPTRNDAIAAFVAWAQASPARLETDAVDGMALFLAERLPCKHGRRGS